ncbi:nuclear assembly factor, partial [Thalictrum thalictroides]
FLSPVPPVDVTLDSWNEPHHQTLPVGIILSIMDAKVVVEGVEKHNPLNEGSNLWITETRSPLGVVDDIFGPVKNPFYIVRYNSDQEVPAGICHGTPVSFVADFAEHVVNDNNLYKKGYDVSGENDKEISKEVEFSDDEKEAEYKRAQNMAKKRACARHIQIPYDGRRKYDRFVTDVGYCKSDKYVSTYVKSKFCDREYNKFIDNSYVDYGEYDYSKETYYNEDLDGRERSTGGCNVSSRLDGISKAT